MCRQMTTNATDDLVSMSTVCPTRVGSVDLLQQNVTVTMEKRAKSGSGSNALPAAPGEPLPETAKTDLPQKIFPVIRKRDSNRTDAVLLKPEDYPPPPRVERGGTRDGLVVGGTGSRAVDRNPGQRLVPDPSARKGCTAAKQRLISCHQ